MKAVRTIAYAFVGVVVGAGFASGRELVSFFAAFGPQGLVGALLAAAAFTFLGMAIADLGHRLRASSHEVLIEAICGRGVVGSFVDRLILFFMFAVTVVMLAGAGALAEQEFGVPSFVGSTFVAALVVGLVCLDAPKVIAAIGAITPLLVVVASGLALYAIGTRPSGVAPPAPLPPGTRHWLVSAVLYVSYNLVASAPILAVLGGSAPDRRTAVRGGVLGGAMLGGLMLVMSAGLLARAEQVASLPMPMLAIADELSPVLAKLMAAIVFGMIVNTAVGTHYAFLARALPLGTPAFRGAAVASGAVALLGSFVGFTTLVSEIYPAFGYLGLVLIGAVTLGWVRRDAIGTPVTAGAAEGPPPGRP